MIVPDFRLGGSSRDALKLAYIKAATAVADAIPGVESTAPHPRDHSIDDYSVALKEHGDRLTRLFTLWSDLRDLSESCTDHE